MRPEKLATLRRDRDIRGLYLANPLWPLQELYHLRNPPFVADKEFTRLDLDALVHDDGRRAFFSSAKPTRYHASECEKRFKATFPVPALVAGLPWRFVKDTTTPVLPDPAFVPVDFRYIDRRLTR